jgi:hypothetical protein
MAYKKSMTDGPCPSSLLRVSFLLKSKLVARNSIGLATICRKVNGGQAEGLSLIYWPPCLLGGAAAVGVVSLWLAVLETKQVSPLGKEIGFS